MENLNFTFSPSEDETKGFAPTRQKFWRGGLIPRRASTRGGLRNRGSGLAPRFDTLYF